MCKCKARFLIALLTFGIGVFGVSVWLIKDRYTPEVAKRDFASPVIVTSHESAGVSLPCEITYEGQSKVRGLLFSGRNPAEVRDLLASGANVDSTGDSCIHMEPSPRDQTLLMISSASGDIEIVKLLLANGANINAIDTWRDTPLTYAIRAKHLEIITMLIEKGADVNSKGENGETPLMQAASVGNTKIIEYLLNKGADLHAKDEHGVTALLYAAADKNQKAMRLLLNRGADPNTRDKDGRPAEIYLKNGFPHEYVNWKM